MDNVKVTRSAKALDEQSNPALGLSEILFDALVSIEAGDTDSARLNLTDLVQLADSLRLHCQSVSLLASQLVSAVEVE